MPLKKIPQFFNAPSTTLESTEWRTKSLGLKGIAFKSSKINFEISRRTV